MYPTVMPNITLKVVDIWKKIQKQALITQIDIVEMETDGINISTLVQAFIQSMSAIKTFELVLISSNLPNPILLRLLHNISLANVDCKALAYYINAILLRNIL